MERANRVFRWRLAGSLHWFVTWPVDGFGAGMRAISRLIFGSSRGSVPKNGTEGVCNGFVARLEKHRPVTLSLRPSAEKSGRKICVRDENWDRKRRKGTREGVFFPSSFSSHPAFSRASPLRIRPETITHLRFAAISNLFLPAVERFGGKVDKSEEI